MHSGSDQVDKRTLTNWCLRELRSDSRGYLDSAGEVNCTALAEACAHAHGHDEWLDDETHEVWDAALDAAERASK